MNTMKYANWTGVMTAVFAAATVFRSAAAEPANAARPEKSCTGTVASVAPNDHVLNVNGWLMFKKSFNLGDNCTFNLWQKPAATAADLHPGEKVQVTYQNVDGVLIASRVVQRPMREVGTVKAIDPVKHTLTLLGPVWDREFKLAADCNVVLRDDKTGSFADIQPGSHITVIYETPGDKPVARQIAQTSQEFTGQLTAIDLGERTVKAKSFLDTKKFNVADNCTILVDGKLNGKLSDLRPDARLVFSYDEINGVNVVNRIAPGSRQPVQTNSVATTTSPMSAY